MRVWFAAAAAAAAYALTYLAINHWQRGTRGIDTLRDIASGVLQGQGREAWAYSVVALLAAACVLQVVVTPRSPAALSHPAWAAIGRASYSGYLLHLLVLWLAGAALEMRVRDLALMPRLAAFVAVWLVTVALSRWCFRFVELPAARWLGGGRRVVPPTLSLGPR